MTSDPITNLPPPESTFEWPRQAAREKNWAEAISRWSVLRSAYPEQPTPWLQGAAALIEAGELDEADILLEQARRLFPKHPHTLTESAVLAMLREQWDAANAFLHRAREEHPSNVQTWLKSAKYAELRGDLDQAKDYYLHARQCAPDRHESYVQYAEMYMRAQRWKDALEIWKSVRERFPTIRAGYMRAADAARELKQFQEARRILLSLQYGSDFSNSEHIKQPPKMQRAAHTSIQGLLELIWTKAVFNLKSEVHRNYLSYGWWILEPLLHMIVYYIVFGLLLKRGGDNFTVFLLTGLAPWMWFMKAVSGSSNSILTGQSLMLQVGLPSIVFPLVSLLQATIKQIPVFLLLFGFVWLQGHAPGSHWWGLVPVVAVQALLTVAFACLIAAIIPFIRDLSYLVPTGLMFLMFLSGVFYDYRMISPDWQELFLLNPIAFLLKSYREIFLDGILPDFSTLAWWGLASAIISAFMLAAFKRLRYVYPRIVME